MGSTIQATQPRDKGNPVGLAPHCPSPTDAILLPLEGLCRMFTRMASLGGASDSNWGLWGRLLALMGASGSGKTTLLTALAGQLPASPGMQLHGIIRVNGRPHTRSHHRQGFVAQEDVFYSQLTVRCAPSASNAVIHLRVCETGLTVSCI